jgi:leader peptidase (prepilin peptidase) / N-methyltransferase
LPLLPDAYWRTVAFLFGAVIGSFLNVVIWRLPRGRNLSHPGSHCPNCNHTIRWWENIPILSFLMLRARCSGCAKPISWRYPGVELLTALLFLALVWHFGPTLQAIAYCLFAATLVAAFFIDLELFIIPEELNTFALLTGFALDAYRISQVGAKGLLWGWLPPSILGAVVCAGVFVAIQLLGYGLFRKEAMGEGDVKLARAIGAMLPLQQALVSFFLAIAVGAVVGVAKIAWDASRGKSVAKADGSADNSNVEDGSDEVDEDWIPYDAKYIARSGLMYLTFADLGDQFVRFVKRLRTGSEREPEIEDELEETPTTIPFGPFMVLGCLLSIFVGDRLVDAYLTWSGLK